MTENMLRPPVNRAMRVLDRSAFERKVPIAAARIFSNSHISLCRKELEKSKEILHSVRTQLIVPDPDSEFAKLGRKCLLLSQDIKHDGTSSFEPFTLTDADFTRQMLQHGVMY